jgi:nucleoside-diphosphate-sugar epimerase
MKILLTGGTVFVSRFVATYFINKGHEVFVLNRGTHEQVQGVSLIKSDRHYLNDSLKKHHFNAIFDICAYNEADVETLLEGLATYDDYILISSSAVYPETLTQPFNEKQPLGENKIWGSYGIGKIAAEKFLMNHNPHAYILRPPYLYGPMQNLYREPFVFECAENNRKFFVPNDGKMKLQFFHVEDLCIVMEKIIDTHPAQHVINVGNKDVVDINTFVNLCYKVVNAPLDIIYVTLHVNQRDYFCFYDYEYVLDVAELKKLLPNQKDLYQGLKESYEWYKSHKNEVRKKPFIQFIHDNLEE